MPLISRLRAWRWVRGTPPPPSYANISEEVCNYMPPQLHECH